MSLYLLNAKFITKAGESEWTEQNRNADLFYVISVFISTSMPFLVFNTFVLSLNVYP